MGKGIIGVHIGQGNNPSTIALVEFSQSYSIRYIDRFTNQNYLAIANKLENIVQNYLSSSKISVILIRIDITGIGSPINDLILMNTMSKDINRKNIELVYLTGGAKVEKINNELMLPKELMYSRLKILDQINRILYSDSLENIIKPFLSELREYETKVHPCQKIWNFGSTGLKENDDLGTAIGIACWM